MPFDHERLDVYRLAVEYAARVFTLAGSLNGLHRAARDQILRASQSIALNIAEGNGKRSMLDRQRFFEIARGSALECAATQDILFACGALSAEEYRDGQELLERIVCMLSRMTEK